MGILNYPLDFELPLVEMERQLEILRDEISGGNQSRMDEYAKLETKVAKFRNETYGSLTSYQRVQLSRHFDRPFTLDYVKFLLDDFIEFHGDRSFKDDKSIVGGTGKLGEFPVMVVGHQRGRSMQERVSRNFGMPQPEGYRKALRLFRLAEKFALPVITFIDTQGAYPGIEAEERGQSEAIARNLSELSELTVPVICIVIGEGGSGGALALGVGDKILMLENACYSVISPEGCASILWHTKDEEPSKEKAAVAADILQVTADRLKALGIVDEVVLEPTGGAHSNHKEAAENLGAAIKRNLEELSKLNIEQLLNLRYEKFRKIGVFYPE